jgi:hypothetical protein
MSRKELVQALEAKWAVKAKYLGMPSCAYEITGEKGTFRIDKAGLILDPDGREHGMEELLADAPAQAAGESKPAETGEPNFQGYAFSLEGHTVTSLRNLVNMLASKQALISAAFCLEQPLVERELPKIGLDHDREVDTFVAVWLTWRGASSGEIGPRNAHADSATSEGKSDSEEMIAFRDLAIGMDANAKKLKHSSLKPAQEENPKFAFRTWLIRLA